MVADAELVGQAHDRQLDLAHRHTRRKGLDGMRLQREHGLERPLLRSGGLAHEHGPLELALIAVDVRPGAGDEHVALLDPVSFHEAMRHRRRPPAHEHRGDAVALEADGPPARQLADYLFQALDRRRHVALHLGLAGDDRVLHAAVRTRRPVAAELDALDLGS